MKKFFLTATALMLMTTPAFAAQPAFTPDIEVKVNGLVCDFCARAVDKVFRKQAAVNDVTVNLDDGQILVDLKDGQTLEDTQIEKMVTDSGYALKEIIRTQ